MRHRFGDQRSRSGRAPTGESFGRKQRDVSTWPPFLLPCRGTLPRCSCSREYADPTVSACTHFTKVHKKKTFTSALDGIPGIGPKTKAGIDKTIRHGGKGSKEASNTGIIDGCRIMTPQLVDIQLKEHLD